MDPVFRAAFNRGFSPELYGRYVDELQHRVDTAIPFRLAETPLFVPDKLRERLVTASEEIVAELSDPTNIERMSEAIPERWRTAGQDRLPNFAQIDFAIVREPDGSLGPRLIELQGFPSLTAFQVFQSELWDELLQEIEGLDRPWTCRFSGLDWEGFLDLARRTIVGDHDPREVVLLDLDPFEQKTACDFAATRKLFGVDAVDPRELLKDGSQLFRRDPDHPSKRIPVRRIHNRIVFDELERSGRSMPFDYREPLDVEWTPHPNWYWIWSKYSIPFLKHRSVPRATLLSELEVIPDDLETGWVLKPLFSFAGGGVNVEPTRADLDAVSREQRKFWCLQEKIEYAPGLLTVDGHGVKAEIRMMFLRPDDEPRPILAENLVRLSRGKMHGVDFNRNLDWVGSSVGLYPLERNDRP